MVHFAMLSLVSSLISRAVCYRQEFESRPNVLFIVIDDLRPELGCFGAPVKTPNIDQLAAHSIKFNNSFAQQALCAPSRTSFLTSRRPDTTKVFDLCKFWRETGGNFTTLPQYFKENGYFTASMGKVFHYGSASNFTDDYPYSWSVPSYHPSTLQYKRAKEYLDLYPIQTIKMAPNKDLPASLPTVAFETYSDLREREDIAALNLSFPYGPMPDEYHLLIRQHYYAATSYVDSMVGRVLHALEDSGFAENTIIVLIGDHGWQLGEHSEFAKYSNYAFATRVPLLIHVPPRMKTNLRMKKFNFQDVFQAPSVQRREGSGVTSDAFVELLDVFPTVVDLAGLPSLSYCPSASHDVKVCTEGTSLSPLITSVTAGSEMLWKTCTFSQYPRPGVEPQINTDSPLQQNITIMGHTVQTKNFRFAEWVGFDPKTSESDWSTVFARELYDLEKDPEENHNVAGKDKYQFIVERLTRVLRKGWKACLPSSN